MMKEKLTCLEPNPNLNPHVYYPNNHIPEKKEHFSIPIMDINSYKKMIPQTTIGKKFNLKLKIKEYDPTKKKPKDDKYKSNKTYINLLEGRWTSEEDELLKKGFEMYGKQWTLISNEVVKTRNKFSCSQRAKTLKMV